AVVPCLVIIGLSALINLAVQTIFNPMQRLEPVWAAALLALNIVELAGLLFLTGGLQNPFSFLFLAPGLISATALPFPLTLALGHLPDLARAGEDRAGGRALRRSQDIARAGDALPRHPGENRAALRFRRAVR